MRPPLQATAVDRRTIDQEIGRLNEGLFELVRTMHFRREALVQFDQELRQLRHEEERLQLEAENVRGADVVSIADWKVVRNVLERHRDALQRRAIAAAGVRCTLAEMTRDMNQKQAYRAILHKRVAELNDNVVSFSTEQK